MMNTSNLHNEFQNQIPSKGDKILNPVSGRYVVVGNAAWRKLVLAGHVNGAYKGLNSVKPMKEKVKKLPKVVEQELEQELESSDDEDLDALELRLEEALRKKEMLKTSKTPKAPPNTPKKRVGRPKTVVFQSKTIELEDEDSGSEIEFD